MEEEQEPFEDCCLGLTAIAARLRKEWQIHKKELADVRDIMRNSAAQLADCQEDLRTARQQVVDRDTTISGLEAELSSFKKENDDLRQLSRARSDQVHHMIAQLEAQNAFYADVISKDRESAEKTNTQLYHTVMQLLTLVPTLPLASDDALVLKFARCLPVGEANATKIEIVWGQCEDTLFPLTWDVHYHPIYGTPEQFFTCHPETFFRRADGAFYLLKPVPHPMPIPPPSDIPAVAAQLIPDSPTAGNANPVEVPAVEVAECTSCQPGQQATSPLADTKRPAAPEDESAASLSDAPASIPGPPLSKPQTSQARPQTKSLETGCSTSSEGAAKPPPSQANTKSLETWFPKLHREHREKVPPLPKGAVTERIAQQKKGQRGAQEMGYEPHPAQVHPAPTQADGRVTPAATQQVRRTAAQGKAPVTPSPQAVEGPRPPSSKGLQNGRRNGSRAQRDHQQPPGNVPTSAPGLGPKRGGGLSMSVASSAPPPGPPLPQTDPAAHVAVASQLPPQASIHQASPAPAPAHVAVASQLPTQASIPQAPLAPAPAQQYLVVTPMAPPRDSRPPLPRVVPAKVAAGWSQTRNAVGSISVPAKEGPTASPGTSVHSGSSAKTGTVVPAKEGPPASPGTSVHSGSSAKTGSAVPAKEGPSASPGTSLHSGSSGKTGVVANTAVAKKGPLEGAIGSAACGSTRSLSTLDSASVASSVMGGQGVAAPLRAVPGGEGLLSKAGLSKSALKRMRKKAAKAA